MSILNLNDFFVEIFPYRRWTAAEPWLAMDERHVIAMAIDGAPENVMTISELHWCLSTGTFRPRFQAPVVSPHLRGNVALKALQPFVENFFE